ncbi:uncharacterized protein LOC114273999 isoform X2 [Camellia sinensis]|uniref:uncharacterized protein LOC114273999 isoform X2 n=2 Tax=Camellia sinensis TaxID=4442 RepID=UPI001036D8EB|nr:uncharacterized protein LOC114273999 isoform X2 [Camellia sinensis]
MRSNGFPIPIIQSIPIRMLLMPVHGSMVPVQVEGSDEQYQQSLLRSRFLQSRRLVQDKRPSSSVAASELGFLRQRHTQWFKIDDVGMDTVMFLGQIDDVCTGVIYIIFLFMENMYTLYVLLVRFCLIWILIVGLDSICICWIILCLWILIFFDMYS